MSFTPPGPPSAFPILDYTINSNQNPQAVVDENENEKETKINSELEKNNDNANGYPNEIVDYHTTIKQDKKADSQLPPPPLPPVTSVLGTSEPLLELTKSILGGKIIQTEDIGNIIILTPEQTKEYLRLAIFPSTVYYSNTPKNRLKLGLQNEYSKHITVNMYKSYKSQLKTLSECDLLLENNMYQAGIYELQNDFKSTVNLLKSKEFEFTASVFKMIQEGLPEEEQVVKVNQAEELVEPVVKDEPEKEPVVKDEPEKELVVKPVGKELLVKPLAGGRLGQPRTADPTVPFPDLIHRYNKDDNQCDASLLYFFDKSNIEATGLYKERKFINAYIGKRKYGIVKNRLTRMDVDLPVTNAKYTFVNISVSHEEQTKSIGMVTPQMGALASAFIQVNWNISEGYQSVLKSLEAVQVLQGIGNRLDDMIEYEYHELEALNENSRPDAQINGDIDVYVLTYATILKIIVDMNDEHFNRYISELLVHDDDAGDLDIFNTDEFRNTKKKMCEVFNQNPDNIVIPMHMFESILIKDTMNPRRHEYYPKICINYRIFEITIYNPLYREAPENKAKELANNWYGLINIIYECIFKKIAFEPFEWGGAVEPRHIPIEPTPVENMYKLNSVNLVGPFNVNECNEGPNIYNRNKNFTLDSCNDTEIVIKRKEEPTRISTVGDYATKIDATKDILTSNLLYGPIKSKVTHGAHFPRDKHLGYLSELVYSTDDVIEAVSDKLFKPQNEKYMKTCNGTHVFYVGGFVDDEHSLEAKHTVGPSYTRTFRNNPDGETKQRTNHHLHAWLKIDNVVIDGCITYELWIVARGSSTLDDWANTDSAIVTGIGFNNSRMLKYSNEIVEILHETNKIIVDKCQNLIPAKTDNIKLQVYSSGHSLGGFTGLFLAYDSITQDRLQKFRPDSRQVGKVVSGESIPGKIQINEYIIPIVFQPFVRPESINLISKLPYAIIHTVGENKDDYNREMVDKFEEFIKTQQTGQAGIQDFIKKTLAYIYNADRSISDVRANVERLSRIPVGCPFLRGIQSLISTIAQGFISRIPEKLLVDNMLQKMMEPGLLREMIGILNGNDFASYEFLTRIREKKSPFVVFYYPNLAPKDNVPGLIEYSHSMKNENGLLIELRTTNEKTVFYINNRERVINLGCFKPINYTDILIDPFGVTVSDIPKLIKDNTKGIYKFNNNSDCDQSYGGKRGGSMRKRLIKRTNTKKHQKVKRHIKTIKKKKRKSMYMSKRLKKRTR